MGSGIKRIIWRKASGDAKAVNTGGKILMDAGELYVTLGVEWLPNTTVEDKKKRCLLENIKRRLNTKYYRSSYAL